MTDLKIAFAINEAGFLVSAKEAVKEQSYFCPSCHGKLIFRDGDIYTKHFAHSVDTNCSPETVLHKIAKTIVKETINNNIEGENIYIKHRCNECNTFHMTKIPSKIFSGAEEEVRISDYICDVVGYSGDKKSLGIEILVSHKVPTLKAQNLPIFWIELKAEDIIANPYVWEPIQYKLKPSYCRDCKKRFNRIINIGNKWGIDRELYSPIKNPKYSNYIADKQICCNCKEKILVFWWLGVPFCEERPPDPIPKTIMLRHSRIYRGTYWANTCPKCGFIQEDDQLFILKDSLFKGLPISEDISSFLMYEKIKKS